MSSEWTFDVNDLVWAKMKGYPSWPGRVIDPRDVMKKTTKKITRKDSRCIMFFGSKDHAWINISELKPYHLFKDTLSLSGKTQAFKEACADIEQYIIEQEQNVENNGKAETD